MESESPGRNPRWRLISYGMLGGGLGAALVTAGIALAGPGAGSSASSARTVNACVDSNFVVHVYGSASCPGGETGLALARALTDAEIAELQRLADSDDGNLSKVKRELRRIDNVLDRPGQLNNGEIRNLMEAFNRAQKQASGAAKKSEDTEDSVIGKI